MSKDQAWTTFWKQGFPTSFANQLPNNYTGKLAQFWQSHFTQLNNVKILDIATGNGAIALLAAKTDTVKNNNLEIFAVDYADINPLSSTNNKALIDLYKKINFTSRTPIEELPFPDSTFDLVTSQFGFEYAELNSAAKEIARVVSKYGTFISICHYENSKIHRYCLEDFKAYTKAISDLHLDHKINQVFIAFHDINSEQEVKLALKDSSNLNLLNIIKSDLSELARHYPQAMATIYLDGALKYFFTHYITAEKKHKTKILSSFTKEFHAAYSRIEQQIKATLSNEDVKTFSDVFSSSGLTQNLSEAFYDGSGEVLGWKFEFSK